MLTFQWDGTPNKSPDFNKLKQNSNYPQFPKYDTLPQNQADRADYIQLTQITKTIYDQTINQNSNQNNTFITVAKVDENQKPIAFTSITQENLRGRVAHSFTFNQANQLGRFTTANQTLYSYDQHGNVHKIVQLLNGLQKPKFIDYEYDLISGNVHKVWYQKKQQPTDSIPHDQFIHRYFYDADNRITRVQTSRDNHIWNTDAKYHYYAHGPLARVELGEFNVQGIDYYYNLQGWIKGVNSLEGQDIGKDGQAGNPNENVSQDAFAYQLQYFQGDYQSIQGALTTPAPNKSLYNGNIGAMLTDLKTKGGENLVHYSYDQLNRLKSATSPAFASEYQYDADGNIQKLNRDGNIIDYEYGKANQLDKVSNHLNISYQYDEIGNLIYSAENKDGKTIQDSIHWTVYGKVAKVSRRVLESGQDTQFMTIHYQYDATGNRVQKTVQKSEFISVTHYIRDATGNILATYKETKIEEFHIYGSSRLGTLNLDYDTVTNQLLNDQGKLILGSRNYELTNHLGNVLAVISDKKILLDSVFQADIVSTNDYYPFGMTIQSRSFVTEEYRFGFQGQESEKELFGGNGSFFKYRISDNRLGRFFAIDPLFRKYPWNSSYAFSENRLIDGLELEGLEVVLHNDISFPLPHSFMSLKDDNDILHVYTYGQYGQNGWGLGGAYNSKGALVHLVGKDAENYLTYEYSHYDMTAHEVSAKQIDKEKVVNYFNKEMKNREAALRFLGHAPSFVNEDNGSSAVVYKPYWLTPTLCDSKNCTSVTEDALRKGGYTPFYKPGLGGIPTLSLSVPWIQSLVLSTLSKPKYNGNPDIIDVTQDMKKNYDMTPDKISTNRHPLHNLRNRKTSSHPTVQDEKQFKPDNSPQPLKDRHPLHGLRDRTINRGGGNTTGKL